MNQFVIWLRLLLVAASINAIAALDQRSDTASPQLSRPVVMGAGERIAREMTFPVHRGPLAFTVTHRFEGFDLPAAFRDSIVRIARAQVGRRYVYGGTTPQRGFDCSGLVRYVLSRIDLTLPRTAYLQARVGAPVDPSNLQPGDLLSFGPADSVSHIGIYVGNGKFVHASSVAGRVVISALDRKPSRLIKPLHGARRLLAVGVSPGRGD